MQARQLQHFIALAESATVTHAAERVGISQQGLSASIARLEEEVGIALVHRVGRRLALTEAGERFAVGARRVVLEIEGMLSEARTVDLGEASRLAADGDGRSFRLSRRPPDGDVRPVRSVTA